MRGNIGRTALTLAAVPVLAVSLLFVLPAPHAQAVGKMICFPEVGRAQFDPIVHHNEPEGVSHRHIFFGNAHVLDRPNPNTWTYSELVGTSTTCQNSDDSAVYWVPDLVYTAGPNKGESVPLRKFFAYYRTWDSFNRGPDSGTIPHPPDARVVAGNAEQPASSYQDVRHFNWTCDQRSSRTGPYRTIPEANCAAASGQAVYLTAHIDFPTCWNGDAPAHRPGKVGDTRDNADYRYFTGNRRNASCPSGFGRRVSELRLTVKWDYQGDGSNVALVTDLMQRRAGNPVEPGQTLHGDFWNTWVQDGYQRVVQDCVLRNNNRPDCNGPDRGDQPGDERARAVQAAERNTGGSAESSSAAEPSAPAGPSSEPSDNPDSGGSGHQHGHGKAGAHGSPSAEPRGSAEDSSDSLTALVGRLQQLVDRLEAQVAKLNR